MFTMFLHTKMLNTSKNNKKFNKVFYAITQPVMITVKTKCVISSAACAMAVRLHSGETIVKNVSHKVLLNRFEISIRYIHFKNKVITQLGTL